MSLGLRVLTAIGILGAFLAVKLSLDAGDAWRSARDADVLRLLNAHRTPLLVAEGALATERGLTNGALANLATTGQAVRSAITAQRAKAEQSRAQALRDFAELPGAASPQVIEARNAENSAATRLNELRRAI